MSNSDTLAIGELEEAAQVATSALGFPLEVMNTGGGIWLAIGRVPADTTVEVVIGDGDTDTKYGWSVNRTDERGDHMDTLAEGVTNALPGSLPPDPRSHPSGDRTDGPQRPPRQPLGATRPDRPPHR